MPRYILEITDHKVHPIVHGHNGPSGGGILLLLALPSAADAKRCAAAGIYSAQHQPVFAPTPQGQQPGATLHSKMFSPVTVDVNPHSANAPDYGRGGTGEFDTYIAQGHMLAIGTTHNESTSDHRRGRPATTALPDCPAEQDAHFPPRES